MPETTIEKRCPKCKDVKALDKFWRNKSCKNGRQGQCKDCSRISRYRYGHSAKGKATKATYVKTDKSKAIQTRYRQSSEGKVSHKRHIRKYPSKYKARNAVSSEIEHGRMPSAKNLICEHCDKAARQYHHHKGYAPEHRLNVIPMCRKCHIVADRIIHKAIHIHKVPSKL